MMDYLKEKLQQYLPLIEEFLTNLLLEDAEIEVISSKEMSHSEVLSETDENSICLYSRDSNHLMDIIVILDEEWYGLLSSIKLGIEEKVRNDTTIELLKEFAGDLSDTVMEKIESDGNELPEPEDIQVLTLSDLEEVLKHSDYFLSNMEIKGIADDRVRAGCLFGNPEALLESEEDESIDEEEPEEDSEEYDKPTEEVVSPLDEQKSEEKDGGEEASSGLHNEFVEFEETILSRLDGDRNIDLLKDVELDVSVELGSIELPLGKILQLTKGSVLELEKLASEPVDILVNGRQFAHGEVVVIDECFGVRISNLVTTKELPVE